MEGGGDAGIEVIANAAVTLFFNGVGKFQTLVDGILVVGDVGATTIGGITEANLLDKTAIESISNNWTITADNFTFNDDKQLRMGSGADMALKYDSGADAFEMDAIGTTDFILRLAVTDAMIRATANAGVALSFNGAEKIVTITDGITVTGDVGATTFNDVALTDGGAATNFLNETGVYSVPPAGAVDSVFTRTGAVVALTGDYAAFYTRPGDVETITALWHFHAGIHLDDNDHVQLGTLTGGDFRVYFDNLTARMDVIGTVADFILRLNSTELAIWAIANGAVNFYNNGVLEARTADHAVAGSEGGFQVKDIDGNMQGSGYYTMPVITKTAALTLAPTHVHKTIRITNVTGTITFANDADIVVDSIGWIINTTTSNQVLGATSNNLEVFSGDAVANNTGNMTLAGKGWCTWRKLSTTEYELVGVGLS
ncbi:MAG: hypothetical protein V3S69_01420, partial [Dehalococcoidales bacterium]